MSPVIPIAAVDITAVAEQSARAAAWVAKVLQERKRKEERCAALILRELGMLVTAGYALNNAGRAVTAPLVRYSPDWPMEEKERVFDALDAFLGDTVILPEITRSASALGQIADNLRQGTYRLDREVFGAIKGLELDVVSQFGSELVETTRDRERIGYTRLPWLWRGMVLGAQDHNLEAVAESVRRVYEVPDSSLKQPPSGMKLPSVVTQMVEDVRDFVDRRWLSMIDEHTGRLRTAMSMRYAEMPTPDWLPALQAGSNQP